MKKEEIIKSLETMTLVELNDLVKEIEKHFNVSATMAVAGPASEEENKAPSEVNVVLTGFEAGASKVAIIKLVAKTLGKGLMDAKKMLDKLPLIIKEKVKTEEADELKDLFVAQKAIIEIK